MIGVLGQVSSPVREGGTGEMIFSQDGGASLRGDSQRRAIARSPSGTEVVVMRYEKGIAYVRPWDELSGASEPGQCGRGPRPEPVGIGELKENFDAYLE